MRHHRHRCPPGWAVPNWSSWLIVSPSPDTTADTTQPGFDEGFHDLVPMGIAYDYLFANEKFDKADKIMEQLLLGRQNLESHYAIKWKDKRPVIRPRRLHFK